MTTLSVLVVLVALLGQGSSLFRPPRVPPRLPRANAMLQARLPRGDKIVGGVETSPGDFPFLVALKFDKQQFCGGSIINEYYILTAAHCTYFIGPDNIGKVTITAAEFNLNDDEENEQVIGIENVFVHPEYNNTNMLNDIAVLELACPLDFSRNDTKPVKLSEGGDCDRGPFTVAGWGTIEYQGSGSDIPLKVDVDYVPTDTCSQQNIDIAPVTENQICAAAPGKDSCQGDSGGPLFNTKCENGTVLVGVVSWGNGCAFPDYPGVYARVSSYLDWIRGIIEG